jgi:hypothetical protein
MNKPARAGFFHARGKQGAGQKKTASNPKIATPLKPHHIRARRDPMADRVPWF